MSNRPFSWSKSWRRYAREAGMRGTPPTISGFHEAGQTLTVTPGTWPLAGSVLDYQWLRDGEPIAGATATTYLMTAADEGRQIACGIVATGPNNVIQPAVAIAQYPPRPSLFLDLRGPTLDPRIAFTRSSIATRVNAQGVLETLTNDQPRFEHDPATLEPLGLRIEEARTNSIPNSTMVGASSGSLPTGWQTALGTVVATVVGLGIERGVPYIDIRWAGTTNSTSTGLRPVTGTTIAAASGQTWTGSWSARLIAGSLSEITDIRINTLGLQADGSTATTDSFSVVVTSAFMAATNPFNGRVSVTATLADALTAHLRQSILFSHANGVAIDFTFRFYMPQLEQGAFLTTWIPTSSAAVTRQAESATISGTNFTNIFSGFPVTMLAEAACSVDTDAVAGSRGIAQISNGGGTERCLLTKTAPSNRGGATVTTASVSQASITTAVQEWPAGSNEYKRLAIACATDDVAFAFEGAIVGTDALATMPTVTQLEVGWAAGQNRHSLIKSLTLWPYRRSNAWLQSITS